MKKNIIILWATYNNLTIIDEANKRWINRYFKCKCKCWNIKTIRMSFILNWWTKSCWCILKDFLKTKPWLKHWKSNYKMYKTFHSMKQRCDNTKVKNFNNYWWRWIKCEWNTFEEFYNDMEGTYKEWLELDRKDNNWNYCKENCHWTSHMKNNWNKRNNILISLNWESKCLSEWCKILWLKYAKWIYRYKNNIPLDANVKRIRDNLWRFKTIIFR